MSDEEKRLPEDESGGDESESQGMPPKDERSIPSKGEASPPNDSTSGKTQEDAPADSYQGEAYDFDSDHADLIEEESADVDDPNYDFDADHAGMYEDEDSVDHEAGNQIHDYQDHEHVGHPPAAQPYQPEEKAPEFDPFEDVASSIEEGLGVGQDRRGRGEQGEMTFLEHLEDLRGTIFKSVVAFLLGMGVMGFFIPNVADVLGWPLMTAQKMHGFEEFQNPIMYKPLGVFMVIIQMVFMGGLGLALPFILFFVSQFVAPGLTKKELRVLAPACISAFQLFIMGVLITYFLILPPGLYFAILATSWLDFELLLAATEYYSLVIWLCLGVGALFQFPLVIIILSYIGIISVQLLTKSRRLVFVIMLIVSALITPGAEPFTFLVLTGFLYVLYEGSIVVARMIGKRGHDEEEEIPS